MRRILKANIAATVVTVLTAGLLGSAPAFAHVSLLDPNGGEVLPTYSVFAITWQLTVPHTQLDWDLYYSVTGPTGPWLVIEEDIPVGDGTPGSVHRYDWAVPGDISSSVRVRIVQDNTGFDYEDVSDADLAIVDGPFFADSFETGTTGGWTVTVE